MRTRAHSLACALLALACGAAGPSGEESVRASIDRLIAADNRSDLAQVLDSYCRDAELRPPQGAPIRGHEAIRLQYTGIFTTWRPRLEVIHTETRMENGLGFDRGRTKGTLLPVTGGEPELVDDEYEAILRAEDGTWRVLRLEWRPLSSDER